ncbi:hypothetical protein [Streptomyces canus]|uniref:hypothetical protein n=1 Tax=Streptomyces canus TaxID=58343 RepID=UPI003869EFC8|nr:hypothetical protein OH824_37760 [Streptomyces canus]
MIGHYAHEHEAGKALLQELIRGGVEGHTAGDASNALLGAVQRGYAAGPVVRLQELLETSSQFASALETVQGRQISAPLSALGRQIEFLTREVEEAAEDLGAPVRVRPWTPRRHPAPARPPAPFAATAAVAVPGACLTVVVACA